MFKSKTISPLIILLFFCGQCYASGTGILVVGDSAITKVDSLSYSTDDVVVTATRVRRR
ncbi:MAG: hypothetical protein U5J96_16405 [Ignavibacteriaceae bacterium]|nr:hypothetical protein [Ignavibacteriaceae bacterium]